MLLPADPVVEVPAARSLVVPVLLGRGVLPLLLGGVTFSFHLPCLGDGFYPSLKKLLRLRGTGSVPPLNIHLVRNLRLPCSLWYLTIQSLSVL